MEIEYSSKARDDIQFWQKSGQKQVQKRITNIIADILSHPYHGIGKPHPLKENLSSYWSRRITDGDRIVYKVENNTLYIYSLKGHYD